MYGRPPDDNERRYLRAMWREVRLANRIFTFGFGFGCLGGMVLAVGSVFLAQKDHDAGGIIGSGLIGIMGLGLAGLFGFLASMSLRAARQSFPARPVVEDIEGPFRIQSTRSRPFSWLGDNLVMRNPELSEEAREVWRAPRLLFASMLAARAKVTFVKGKEWAGRIAADALRRGVPVTGVGEDAKTMCTALAAVAFYAKQDPTIEDTDALDRIVNGFDAAVRDLPSVWRSRSVLAGVVHPRRGGGVAIAIDESYSTAVLLVQALFAVLAGLTGILVLGSIVAIARRGPIIRRLRAALPDVA